ncbi:MAG: winged helix-turn-helix domain-containing protein [Actinomycetota bacterium]|nr:winged helix-turn-helix domain-containing protein [Actinomycetota bacterium]
MRVLDLTQAPARPSVEVRSHPAVDLLISIVTFKTPESIETFECGSEWFERVEGLLSPGLRAALAELGEEAGKEWGGLVGLALQGPPDEGLDGFLERTAAADPVEIWLLLAGGHAPAGGHVDRDVFLRAAAGDSIARERLLDAADDPEHRRPLLEGLFARSPARTKELVMDVLRRWRSDVYARDEDRLAQALRVDADAKRRAGYSMKPEELIEFATNGLEYRPEPWIRGVVLVPHVAMRPWNVLCAHDDLFILCYPVADESLGIDETAPPAGLLRLHKALGDEKRLRMLKMLARSSSTLQELADAVGLQKSSAHHHLVILRAAGLVRVTAEEVSRYTLRREVIPEASGLLQAFLGEEER